MTGATRSYDNGPKNHWRRTIWNEVLKRSQGRHKTDPILYLSGPQNIDRDVAVKKGVPSGNLIAVDRCWDNVEAVRAAGGSAIHGDAMDVLVNWPINRPVAAVLMDFCSGIESSNSEVFDAFQRRPLRNAAIVLNFMRGRDPWSNSWRAALKGAGLYMPLDKLTATARGDDSVEPQNRAYQYLLMHAWDFVCLVRSGGRSHDRKTGLRTFWSPDSAAERLRFNAAVGNLVAVMRPRFHSYRSGNLVFDTVVFQHYSSYMSEANGDNIEAADSDIERCMTRDAATVRKIAATLAVRTTRLKAMHA